MKQSGPGDPDRPENGKVLHQLRKHVYERTRHEKVTQILSFLLFYKYWVLFFSLIFLLLFPPFIHSSTFKKYFMEVALTFLLLASVNFLNEISKGIRFLVIFAFMAFSFNWIAFLIPEVSLQEIRNVVLTSFFVTLFYHIIRQIINSENVDTKVIIGAISAYFLLGIIGGFIITLVEISIPGSFNMPLQANDSVFFSFTTITTTGYGNIFPVKPQSQTISYFLAITGQVYMTVLVAIIVGKHLMHSSRRES